MSHLDGESRVLGVGVGLVHGGALHLVGVVEVSDKNIGGLEEEYDKEEKGKQGGGRRRR